MKLRVCCIEIENFKALSKLTIRPNESFNIIIGENNTGKSSLFEAIHLWEKCYKTLIQANGKKFYKLTGTNTRYVSYQDLDFLRITNDDDLFHSAGNDTCAIVSMTLKLEQEEFSLGIKITKPNSISNAFLRIQPIDSNEFDRFSKEIITHGKSLNDAIFIYQTRPVAVVSQYEPYYNEAQVKKRIQRGQSHEVLRNKITLKQDSQGQLENSMSKILGAQVKFIFPPKTRRSKDEFIELKVESNNKNLDIHLQGSGFLQVAEIISTIEYIDAPLKLLLVDEPDSHIHSKLQKNLINHLREIDHNQFFVISHNDQFVTNAKDNEVFFLNEDAKDSGELKPLPPESFDIIKNSLGGIIMSLDRLNEAKRVIFVEGNDDLEYIGALVGAYNSITLNNKFDINKCIFFPLRGKDNIASKIEYIKRTLTSLFKNKIYGVIFDMDFSTRSVDENLKKSLKNKIGGQAIVFSHNGYCIESVLFSDSDLLIKFLCSVIDDSAKNDIIKNTVNEWLKNIEEEMRNVNSKTYSSLEERFKGQINNRPELSGMSINEFVRDLNITGSFQVHRIMSKNLIAQFVLEFEEKLECKIFHRTDDGHEAISSGLLSLYIKKITTSDQLFPSYLELVKSIFDDN